MVVVTGASAGIGRATARAFGEQGAAVALLARGRDGLECAAREIEASGGRSLVIVTDVADPQQVEQAAERVERELGPIDVWVNNAMTTIFAPFHEITSEEYTRATNVTYLGTVYGTMSALKRMRQRDAGTIVQVGSALAYRAIPLQAPYCGAKHAIRGFTDSIRCELYHDRSNVHITMVQLPGLNTPQFDWCESRLPNRPQPVPPIFQPEVAARGIVWAARHRRREVFVGRSALKAIWLNKLAPGLADRYLGKIGFSAQQAEEPVQSNRSANLYAPVPGDHGAHGRFDRRATARSWQLWLTTHRIQLALTALIIAMFVTIGAVAFSGS